MALAEDPAMHCGVILAGGGGTRLWPASRAARPKQFLPLGARPGESLLAATYRRLRPVCDRISVVTAASQAEMVRPELPDLEGEDLLAEPAARNTAAALGLAAVHLSARDPDAVLGAVPSDHHIADEETFAEVASAALTAAATTGQIVTIGVVPTRAEAGFGYLELGGEGPEGTREVSRFVEKPNRETAERYARSGRHLWNAGMFFVSARRLLDEIAAHMPETHRALEAIAGALARGGREEAEREAARLYPALPSVSIDRGVMEKASDVLTIPGDFGWNDIGSWEALAAVRSPDGDGNVTEGQVLALGAHRNILVADDGSLLAAVGVDDLVVVKSGDAILILPRERAQDVREVVRALEEGELSRYL